MATRMDLNGWYKLRWQILERDKYVCQYCGQGAPDVKLEVDHKVALADGGTNDLNNLITSCWACNRGKSGLRQSIVLRRQIKNLHSAKGRGVIPYRQNEVLALLIDIPGLTAVQIRDKCDITTQNAVMVLKRLRMAGKAFRDGKHWYIKPSP